MTIRKIEAGRVITKDLDTFVGQPGTIFYDELTGELRLSDGKTEGGIPIGGSGGGARGYTGSRGYVGSKGAPGYTGSTGTQGVIGYTGSVGLPGLDGAIGYTGSKGLPGSDGAIGYTGSASTAPGYTGSQGEIGYTGSAGTLTVATSSTLGGIKVGNNLSITEDGTLSATSNVILSDNPPLDPTVGTLWYDTISGRLYTWFDNSWIDASPQTEYVLNTATTSILGGIKVGQNLSINLDGTLNARSVVSSDIAPANPNSNVLWYDTVSGRLYTWFDNSWIDTSPTVTYVLTTATSSVLGGIKVGRNLSIGADGTLSANANVVLSDTAPTGPDSNTLWYDTVGGRMYVWFDNNWIDASPTVTYILTTATSSVLGGIKVGKELSISSTGTLNVDLSAVKQDIIPSLDAEYSIGTPDLRWKDIYVSTGSLYIGDLKLSSENGALKVSSTGTYTSSIFLGGTTLSDFNLGLKISGPLTFSDGTTQTSAASKLEISEINTANSLTNTVTNVTAIRFDRDTGFNVTDLGSGEVKVSLGSSFKTWKVAGQDSLVAFGEDTVEFKAGDGITLTTNPTALDKSMTITGYMYWSSKNW